MALLAHNLTTSPLALAEGNSSVTLPPSAVAGKKGAPVNVTAELRGLADAQYAAIRKQIASGLVSIAWEGEVIYDTASLLIVSPPYVPEVKPPVVIKVANFDQEIEETGEPRAIMIYDALPYPVRILSVSGAIRRGAPGAEVYICCHPSSGHEPHSDKFDASQPGMLVETSVVRDRILEEGEEMFAYASSDYVLGHLIVTLQPL